MSPAPKHAPLAPDFTGRKIVVVGLGKTGLSCARWLRARGATLAVIDSRQTPPALEQLRSELPDVALMLGSLDAAALKAADMVILSPGVPLSTPTIQGAIAKGIPVIGDAELFARAAAAPVIAITGSNGKSTVTTLVGQMARQAGIDAAVGGNLGIPVLDLLRPDAALYVVELSSFQLESTFQLPVRAATVLNLSADHMDRYSSFEAYAAAKARVYSHAQRAIVNQDDPPSLALCAEMAERVGFSLGPPPRECDFGIIEHAGESCIAHGAVPLIPVGEVRLAGRHNLSNALAALALAEAAGVMPQRACEVLPRFPGLAHRSEVIAERAGVRWINDSKGTNPGATIAALAGLVPKPAPGDAGPRAVLIAGGDGKGADFSSLVGVVRERTRAVVLIGRDAAPLQRVLAGAAPLHRARDMQAAVEMAAALAIPGDCVLLSPACASFDMFEDYQHRGRAFAEAVAGLPS